MSHRDQHKGMVGTQGSGLNMLPNIGGTAGGGGGAASKYGNPLYNAAASVYRNKGVGSLRMGGGPGGGGMGHINSSIHGGGQEGGGHMDYDPFGRKRYA